MFWCCISQFKHICFVWGVAPEGCWIFLLFLSQFLPTSSPSLFLVIYGMWTEMLSWCFHFLHFNSFVLIHSLKIKVLLIFHSFYLINSLFIQSLCQNREGPPSLHWYQREPCVEGVVPEGMIWFVITQAGSYYR